MTTAVVGRGGEKNKVKMWSSARITFLACP